MGDLSPQPHKTTAHKHNRRALTPVAICLPSLRDRCLDLNNISQEASPPKESDRRVSEKSAPQRQEHTLRCECFHRTARLLLSLKPSTIIPKTVEMIRDVFSRQKNNR